MPKSFIKYSEDRFLKIRVNKSLCLYMLIKDLAELTTLGNCIHCHNCILHQNFYCANFDLYTFAQFNIFRKMLLRKTPNIRHCAMQHLTKKLNAKYMYIFLLIVFTNKAIS